MVGSPSTEEYDFRQWKHFWDFLRKQGWKKKDGKGRIDTSTFFVPKSLAKLQAKVICNLVRIAEKKASETGTPVRTTRTAGKAPGSGVVTVEFKGKKVDVYRDQNSIEAMMNHNIDRNTKLGTEFKEYCRNDIE